MAEGYFNDGVVDIELGEHVFALPTARRRNVAVRLYEDPAAVHDSGGGILHLEMTVQRDRANLGDAEAYIYNQLVALAESDAGDFGYEDNRGHRHVFGDVVCLSGRGEVRGQRFVDMRLNFACSEKSVEPAWGAVPAPPATYAGTDTLQDYRAGGVVLGLAGEMKMSLIRKWPLRELPRARGSRTSTPYSGGAIYFSVAVGYVAGTTNLAMELENIERQIGPGPVALVANGYVYRGLVLEAMRPHHTDRKHTIVEFEFVQDIGRYGAGQWTTTTGLLATTTTTVP